jgi:peptide/nickel transport system permease protein
MFTFLLKRFYQAVIVMFVISLVAFSIQDNLGDPLRELVGQSVSESSATSCATRWDSMIPSS